MNSKVKKIIVFDGICNYCNWAVNFIIKRDTEGVFRFAASQSVSGIKIINKYHLEDVGDDSIILIEDGGYLVRSDAVIEILKDLGSGWKHLRYLRVFPQKLRDWGYSVFAKHRYSLFGKRDSCMIPSDDLKERFLD